MELRTARQIAGFTQLELARRAGVDHSLISLLESGKRDIYTTGYSIVVRIARALHCTPEQLFPLDDDRIVGEATETPTGPVAASKR